MVIGLTYLHDSHGVVVEDYRNILARDLVGGDLV